ncbi:hypothetical protein EYF80_064488 [Liparis tanakae]|uniref:Uncharacterized protein n=1 Tax=Liparis tanakae TaxID=230148 RepID=A0A4Z2EA28_9TELE|nr:hypothetical protein EYF80_064488 [Liparis tanakae]
MRTERRRSTRVRKKGRKAVKRSEGIAPSAAARVPSGKRQQTTTDYKDHKLNKEMKYRQAERQADRQVLGTKRHLRTHLG